MTKKYVFAGASSKMALAAAQELKEQGHSIIGISTSEVEPVYEQFYSIESYDFNVFPAIEGAIDGLVYFPGSINLKPFHRLSQEDFSKDYQLNSLGAVAFVQAYLDNLKKSEQASVVFISSVAAGLGMPFHASVSMAKGALEGLTRALAAELAPGIRVNCVAPSLTDTPLASKFINTPEKLAASRKRNPLAKLGEAADVAHAISFLLGSKAAWLSGQCLAVDGGMSTLRML